TIDGNLDEPVWRRAARLTGFSQYQPVDGLPAVEPTEVLTWYAGDAIYFGIKAREIHGNVVRATHANRDNIDSEDQIQILLDTDNSRQIAFLFGVNPSGFQDTWAPAVRANANFLAQSGTLDGLHDLRRGLVLEASPTMTVRADRSPTIGNGRDYQQKGEFGGDLRWGIRQNLTLNGTINPDFSQVEADVGQVLLNERFALFYPEKRPFFLDGLELFDTPNQLIYTRRIVAPVGGVKLTGK